jgi:hypothetical protein
MTALIIGIIVAGLGIGALISAFQNRGAPVPELGNALPVITPVPQPPPQAPITPVPAASPSPSASPAATASPRPSPSAKPSPSATPSAAASASPAAGAAPAAKTPEPATPSARPVPTASPARPAAIAAAPSPAATVQPAVHPPAPPPAQSALPSYAHPAPTAATGDPAVALVRRYISDLAAGDEAGAYAALGGTAGDRSLDLKEEAFLDKDAHITSIRVTRTDGSGATVDAEITSDHGSYATTFHVTYGPNGSIIDKHDYIKI